MTGRLRHLREFWSQELRISRVRGERSIAEATTFVLAAENRYAVEDRDEARRQRDAFAVEVDQLKTLLAEVEDQRDAMARDLIVLAHRRNDLRRMLAASPEQALRNCLALSDRNAELRRKKEARELRIAELEGRAAKPSVIEGGRLP